MRDDDRQDAIRKEAEALARDVREAFAGDAERWPWLMLQASVRRIDVDLEQHVATVYMHDGSCTDLSGCILLISLIDPNVTRISTFAGDERDTEYRLKSNGRWIAYDEQGHARTSPPGVSL